MLGVSRTPAVPIWGTGENRRSQELDVLAKFRDKALIDERVGARMRVRIPIDGGGAMYVEVKHARLMCFDRAVGPWRQTEKEAEEDALEMGHASRDRYTKRIFLTVPARIEVVEPTEETEAAIQRRAARRNLVEVEQLRRRSA
jgi:hypothetical protein